MEYALSVRVNYVACLQAGIIVPGVALILKRGGEMRFNLSDLNPPAWFNHPDHAGSRICLKVLSSAEMESINKKTSQTKIEYRRGQRFEVEKVDEKKRNELTWSTAIVDWEGIFDENENELPCTDENKVLLMQNAPTFTSWVLESLEQISDDSIQRQEDAEKN